MIDVILTTLVAGAAGLIVHFGQAWFSRYINLLKKKRSLARPHPPGFNPRAP